MRKYGIEFKIVFKCMLGATAENGKFIMPLNEKMSYGDSSDRCESKGFAILLWFLNMLELATCAFLTP